MNSIASRTYYVSQSGNDTQDGSSPATAWRSLDRANRAVLGPGDQLLFEGGTVFRGSLQLNSLDARADAPVVVGSYGSGRATMSAAGHPAISIVNTAGVEVRDLVLTGDQVAYRTAAGIDLVADAPGGRKFDHVTVTGVEVSGFRNGIEVTGWNGAGFRDVRISRAVLHDNLEHGLLTHGPSFDDQQPAYAHQQVVVSEVVAHHNVGDGTNLSRNTGSGIVLGSVDEGTVERSSAHDNGIFCVAPEGPVGIWAYDSRRIVVQHNFSYDNRTGASADGGGFDLDQNVSDSILQYNMSYRNDGAGFLLYSGADNREHARNVIRFNISADDSRRSDRYGGITLSGAVYDVAVYHNTVVTSDEHDIGAPALKLEVGPSAATVRNNILSVTGTSPAVVAASDFSTDQIVLQGNDYANADGPLEIRWDGRSYSRLSNWRAATGQERVGDGDAGTNVDPWPTPPRVPELTDPPDITDAAAFMLSNQSPVAGAGLDLASLFGADLGTTDFWDVALNSPAPSIGAHQPHVPARRPVNEVEGDGVGDGRWPVVVGVAAAALAGLAASGWVRLARGRRRARW